MKKQGLLILIIICMCVPFFIVFTKADNGFNEKEILNLGEEMYLKFLWLVDGSFNEERMDGEYSVNGKKLGKESKIFECSYLKNNKETCVGNGFSEEFNKIFSSNINYDDVYGDILTYNWYKFEDGKYYFTNPNNCKVNRMNLEQKIHIKEVNDDKIIYTVSYINNYNRVINNDFVLIKENNNWKIREAYYYDLCEMEYHIE